MTLAFERGQHGRQNRRLFYSVDRIVYVEGGNSTKGNAESFDALFWKKVIATFQPQLKVKFIPRGSKENIISLINKNTESPSKDILYAIDRDYDHIIGKNYDHKWVLYTFGYSFENDVFYPDILSDIFLSMCPVCEHHDEISNNITHYLSRYCKDIWWAQLADVYGIMMSKKVIDRKRIPKYFMGNHYGCEPLVSKSSLAIDVFKANSTAREKLFFNKPISFEMLPRVAVGHLYAHFCFRLLCFQHSLHSNTTKLTRDAVTSCAINCLCVYLARNAEADISIYFKSIISVI